MRVTIEVRDDLLAEATREFGEDGSNDAEHDLLCELVEAISQAAPELPKTFIVEQTETFRVRASSEQEALQKVADDQEAADVEWLDSNRRLA